MTECSALDKGIMAVHGRQEYLTENASQHPDDRSAHKWQYIHAPTDLCRFDKCTCASRHDEHEHLVYRADRTIITTSEAPERRP